LRVQLFCVAPDNFKFKVSKSGNYKITFANFSSNADNTKMYFNVYKIFPALKSYFSWELSVSKNTGIYWGSIGVEKSLFFEKEIYYIIEVKSSGKSDEIYYYMIDPLYISNPPVLYILATPDKGTIPLTVNFYSDFSDPDPDDTISKIFWDFSDGTTSLENQPIKTFLIPGIYTATCTVTDDEKQSTSKQTNIIVTEQLVNYNDSDGDGISDEFDECFTPQNHCVNSKGCPCENVYSELELKTAVANAEAIKDEIIVSYSNFMVDLTT